MSFTPEAWQSVKQFVDAVITEVCRKNEITEAALYSSTKQPAVVKARSEACRILRSCVLQNEKGRRVALASYGWPHFSGDWQPLSYPNIAKLVGLKNHSSVILILRRCGDDWYLPWDKYTDAELPVLDDAVELTKAVTSSAGRVADD